MTTHNTQEEMGETTELVQIGDRLVVSPKAIEPKPPQGLSEDEDQEINDRALALVDELVEASGSREMELSDGLTNLGVRSQRKAGTELDLLKGRMSEMLSGNGPGSQISKELIDLRLTLDQSMLAQAVKLTRGCVQHRHKH